VYAIYTIQYGSLQYLVKAKPDFPFLLLIAGFLVEGKIQKLLEPLPTEEQNLLKIDSILKVRVILFVVPFYL